METTNFLKTQQITDVHEFLKKLFLTPNDKAVKFFEGKNQIIDDPELFFNAAKKYTINFLLPEKKFAAIKNLDHELKTFIKILTTKDKWDKQLRPAFTYLYYNAEKNEICGSDAHILWVFNAYKFNLGDQNLYINTDKFGDIILSPESELHGVKYPNYIAILPEESQTISNKFYISNYDINLIFYLCKLAKIVGLNIVPIKIGEAVFNGFLLARFIEAFKTSLPNYHILLNVYARDRAAFISESGGRYKGLIMPMIQDDNKLLFHLKN